MPPPQVKSVACKDIKNLRAIFVPISKHHAASHRTQEITTFHNRVTAFSTTASRCSPDPCCHGSWLRARITARVELRSWWRKRDMGPREIVDPGDSHEVVPPPASHPKHLTTRCHMTRGIGLPGVRSRPRGGNGEGRGWTPKPSATVSRPRRLSPR
jgi:hypothetical protein